MQRRTSIVVTLTKLNLERVVFDLMGGIREKTASDSSYVVLMVLSLVSVLLFLPLLLCYVVLAWQSLLAARNRAKDRKGVENQ